MWQSTSGFSNPARTIVIKAVCILWCLFQLLLASRLILIEDTKTKAIHLGFALFLAYAVYPFKKSLSPKWYDIPLAITAVFASLYIVLDWQVLLRVGDLLTRDYLVGGLLIVLLLEATRRSIGIGLPMVVIFFSIYCFISDLSIIPDIFAFKSSSFSKYINQIAISTEGIYGIPLRVSASIIFLFVLFGSILEKAGAGQFFTRCALAILGKYKGGPAKASVLSSGLSGMISGSSIANIVTTGTFTIPLMKKVGYPGKKAAAIEVAASTDGQIMPPIMGAAAFIIAEYLNLPYGHVIKAALIPAVASNLALFFVTHLEASKLGLSGLSKSQVPSLLKTLREGFYYIIPIVILLYELIVLRHTPELSAFKSILFLIVIVLIKSMVEERHHGGRGIFKAILKASSIIGSGFIAGAKNTIPVALATASAGIIIGVIGMGFGSIISQVVEVLSLGNVFLLLLIAAFASLLLGMGLPTTATYIVMASLTAPIIVELGEAFGFFIPLIAAHLFCFYFGILADDTPPVGLASYAAAAIAKTPPVETGLQAFLYDIRTAIIPFMFILNPDILLYKISNPLIMVLILIMTVLASFAFTSSIQGWLIKKNTFLDTCLLLITAVILYYPGIFHLLVPQLAISRYFYYIIGICIFLFVYGNQKLKASSSR